MNKILALSLLAVVQKENPAQEYTIIRRLSAHAWSIAAAKQSDTGHAHYL